MHGMIVFWVITVTLPQSPRPLPMSVRISLPILSILLIFDYGNPSLGLRNALNLRFGFISLLFMSITFPDAK